MTIETLTKTSIRSLRSGCPKCGAEGPFYNAVDQSGAEHLIVKNAITKAADQGATIATAYLHICTDNNGREESKDENPFGSKGTPEIVEAERAAENAPAVAGTPAKTDPKLGALFGMMEELFSRPSIDEDEVKRIAQSVIEGMVMPTRTFVQTGTELREVQGVTHKDFGKVLKAIAARRNVQLVGAPGVGKTHMCEQVGEALGRAFYAINFHLQSTASELKGYMSANGEFVPTVVYDWATNPEGGILLCDELDRAHPGILAALNSILSNRFIVLPNRETVKLTENHVILAATNTYGDGPTWEYPAAQKFSAEFKDRFIAMTIEIDTDIELAAAMREGAPVDVTKRAVSYVQRVRANVKREAIAGVVVSPRASQNMAALLAQEVDWDDAVAWTLQKGMEPATWAKVA